MVFSEKLCFSVLTLDRAPFLGPVPRVNLEIPAAPTWWPLQLLCKPRANAEAVDGQRMGRGAWALRAVAGTIRAASGHGIAVGHL